MIVIRDDIRRAYECHGLTIKCNHNDIDVTAVYGTVSYVCFRINTFRTHVRFLSNRNIVDDYFDGSMWFALSKELNAAYSGVNLTSEMLDYILSSFYSYIKGDSTFMRCEL